MAIETGLVCLTKACELCSIDRCWVADVGLVSHLLRGRLEALDVALQRKLTPPLCIYALPIVSKGARPKSRTHWRRRALLSLAGLYHHDLCGDESLGADDRTRGDFGHAVSPPQQQHADVVPVERVPTLVGEEECALLTMLPGHGVRDDVEQRTLLGERVEVVLCVAAIARRLHQVRGSADEFELGDEAHVEKVAEREGVHRLDVDLLDLDEGLATRPGIF
mmetsp:Transcript_40256/g.110822  ORF Transcript_40256/g.110822 Transcript_40256/m.110822 type:complete len:221 (+) Transcript_40256:869-1531(+)